MLLTKTSRSETKFISSLEKHLTTAEPKNSIRHSMPRPQEAFPIPRVGNQKLHQEELEHSDQESLAKDKRVEDHISAKII